jgi:hypothetical protein
MAKFALDPSAGPAETRGFRWSYAARFDENLDQLAAQLRAMCLRDRTAIATATDSVLRADLELAEQAIDICCGSMSCATTASMRRSRCWPCQPRWPASCTRW